MVHINPLFLFLFNPNTPPLLPRNRRTVTTLLSLSSVNHPNQHRSLAAKLHHPSPLSLFSLLLSCSHQRTAAAVIPSPNRPPLPCRSLLLLTELPAIIIFPDKSFSDSVSDASNI